MKSGLLATVVLASSVSTALAQSPVELVDPFIGTAGGGNTFPGAVVPWGMVSVSPHNEPASPSGYIHGEPYFYGFGHTHLSGTGCADYGSILLMVTGDDARAGRRARPGRSLRPAPTDRDALDAGQGLGPLSPGSVRSRYRNEAASPGYYTVTLDSPAVLIEASATLRTGITRITAMESATLTLVLNAGTSLGITGGGEIRISDAQSDSSLLRGSPGPRVEPGVTVEHLDSRVTVEPGATREPRSMQSRHSGAGRNPDSGAVHVGLDSRETPVSITGYNIGGGMCGEANRQVTYFSAQLDREPAASGTWIGEKVSAEPAISGTDQSLGAWLSFEIDAGESITVRVGISYVSSENAELNLAAEQGGNSLETIRKEAADAWQDRLSRIAVKGASHDQLTIFYTALYHSMIHPNVIDDMNGEYPLMGRRGTGVVTGRHRYSLYSLWDTYRTLHPLLTLLFPVTQGDMVQTMVDMYEENGWLPKWELGANETYLMVGDPATIVIADTYTKGVRNFDYERALEAIVQATTVHPGEAAPLIRPGYHDLVSSGYIPADQDTTEDWWVWGPVSTMLEYDLADAAAANMADSLGKVGIATELRNRSFYYRNLFDSGTGFLRPKNRDGTWMSPFDPLATEGSGSWAGSGGPGYVEGNAWNYTWFVPHDLEGLATLFGGKDKMLDKLEQSFANGTFTSTNEPDIGYPYTFARISSRMHRTRELVRSIMQKDFSTGPSGLPGNDDAGAISAWYVFSALGFYPFFPGAPEYVLGESAFDQIVLTLPRSKGDQRKLVIERSGAETADKVTLNGMALGTTITHEEVVRGGRLVFAVQ